MTTDFWECQPESEPWWKPGVDFALVDPADQTPAYTVAPIHEVGKHGANFHNGRRRASFRFFPLDHNAAFLRLLTEKNISIQGQKWCEGMFHSRGRTRLVFVELKAWRRFRLSAPVKQIGATLTLLKRHFPSVLERARWKRALISNRKHPFAYTAHDRNVRRQEEFHSYAKDFMSHWGVKLEAGKSFEL